MSYTNYYSVKNSLFDKTEKSAAAFCDNLIMMSAIQQCVSYLQKAQQEYDAALLEEDKTKANQIKLEIQTYQSSLILTAHVMNNDEDAQI